MKPTMISAAKSRARSLAVTLGVVAVLAGVAVPAALPTAASALPRQEWCEALLIGVRSAGTPAAKQWWWDRIFTSGCTDHY